VKISHADHGSHKYSMASLHGGIVTLIIILAKMHGEIATLKDKVTTLFDLWNGKGK